jgi:hypothetical protein
MAQKLYKWVNKCFWSFLLQDWLHFIFCILHSTTENRELSSLLSTIHWRHVGSMEIKLVSGLF